MPAVVRSEFALALNQVVTERGIEPQVVLDSIKAAILAAYRKDYGSEGLEELTVELNPDNGEARILKGKKDITPPGFGRIAAQTAKQVILQRIREAEKQAILSDYSAKVGNITTGMILRFDGQNIIVDIGRAQAVMPPQEQVPGERYRLNQRLTFYIEGIRETYRGNEIIVSRAHRELVAGLFRREVPEVAQGSVVIKSIAREAGARTKIAVASTQSGVDPVGSCVGQKGVRVQAVINELGGGEKIDIIQWSDDPQQLIMAALAPTTDVKVELNGKTKTATVTVPEDQLSLAIGRDGQNVRLASKLTDWRIDLKGRRGGKVSASVADLEEAKQKVDQLDSAVDEADTAKKTAAAAENSNVLKEEIKEKRDQDTKVKEQQADSQPPASLPNRGQTSDIRQDTAKIGEVIPETKAETTAGVKAEIKEEAKSE